MRGIRGKWEWQAGRLYGFTERALARVVLRWRYGMPADATRLIRLDDVGFAAEGRHHYLPSPWDVLRRILPPNEVSANDVFLDVGCGMGTVLLEAGTRYRFRRLIGLEVVPAFAAVATDALSRNRSRLRCEEFEVVIGDALTYAIPDDVTVVFLNDPFTGDAFDSLVTQLIATVARSPRTIRIIYLHPKEAARLERSAGARLVRFGRRGIRRWSAATYLRLYEIVPLGGRPASRRA